MKLKKLFFATMALFALAACTETPDSPYEFPNGGGGNNGGTTEEGVYINETFKSDFGVFSTAETVGDTPWIIDYSTAKATSYIDGTNKAATSWLISSPVDFTNETEAYVAFEYIIRYSESGKVAANHQLLVSADFAGDAAKATWKDVPYGAVEGSDWATFYKANVDVPAEFMGKSGIVFALRYTATTKASTWEVKNFKVAHGAATGNTPEEPGEAEEYTVAEAIAAFTGAAKPAVVKGYIVGTVDGQVYTDGCRFSGTAESKTNLLLADKADETDPANCMPIQLPSGAVRNALNLVDNPGNYLKEVKLTGSLEKYFGVPGLKTVTKYEIEGETPEEPETPADAYISETFATEFGTFTTQETVGNYPWIIDYSTAKATSYVDTDGDGKADTDKAATSWLVSKSVDFTNETEAYIAFEYIIRYAESGKVADNHQVLVASDFTGDVATANWVNVPYGAVEGTDWNTFYKANVAVPTEFMGKSSVTFALRYTATTKAGTWEVKNFTVAHGAANGETPEQPENPGDGEKTMYTVAEALAAFTGTATPAIVKGYIVGTIDGKSIGEGALFSGSATTATNLLLADDVNETDYTKCLPIQLPSGDVRSALNLVDNPGNYKKMVALTGSLEKYFGVPGLKSVTAYEFEDGNTEEPETPDTPDTPDTPEEPEDPDTPDTPEVPAGENILANGGFEEWNGSTPAAWGKDESNATAHSATIAQSNDAHSGNFAVSVDGATTNKRLGSQKYTLAAGTYVISAYIKQTGDTAGAFKLGYGIIKDGAISNADYKYQTNATTVTSEWTLYTYEFTLTAETEISVLVMNSKVGNGASILVDDVTLIKK